MSGARTKRMKRLSAAMPIVSQLQAHTGDVDSSWLTRRFDYRASGPVWLTLPISRNARGDSPRAESNYRVIEADLDRVSAFGTDYRVDLWPGGSIHTLQVRADDALALRAAEQWISHLEYDGYADDSDYSELVDEWTRESYGQWLYSDMYSSMPEWWQDACDELDPDVVEAAFFAAVDEEGDEWHWVESDGVAWDHKRATEVLVDVVRHETRKRLGRVQD